MYVVAEHDVWWKQKQVWPLIASEVAWYCCMISTALCAAVTTIFSSTTSRCCNWSMSYVCSTVSQMLWWAYVWWFRLLAVLGLCCLFSAGMQISLWFGCDDLPTAKACLMLFVCILSGLCAITGLHAWWWWWCAPDVHTLLAQVWPATLCSLDVDECSAEARCLLFP